jgi:hypothetical protein
LFMKAFFKSSHLGPNKTGIEVKEGKEGAIINVDSRVDLALPPAK